MAKDKKPKITSSTQQYLPITAIKDGVVVLDDHSIRAVVMVSSVNFALKSEDEKNAVLISYQNFLNGLFFPIQLLSTSQRLDLSNYLASVKKAAEGQGNPLLKIQSEEYIGFIGQLLEYANITEKRFFIVIPYYPGGVDVLPGGSNPFKKKEQSPLAANFEKQKKDLAERVEVIIQGMNSIGLNAAALGTEDLLELYYASFNPDSAKNHSISGINDIDAPIIQGGAK